MRRDENAAGARIRIAFLIWNLKPAGAELQLLELIARLDRERYEPYLIVFKRGSLDAECACPLTVLIDERRSGRVRAGISAFVRLLRALGAIRPQILHSFLPEMVLVYGAIAAQLLRIPVFLCNRRASIELYRRGLIRRALEAVALKITDAVVVNAEWLREELVRVDRYPCQRIAVIANGVDTERFRPGMRPRVAEFGWCEGDVVIGMVANFRACKRHEDFVSAAAVVREKHPEARFLLVGNDVGSLKDVRRLVSELRLEDVVRIVTGCSRPEELYGSMHVVVCTSDTEGLSNTLLEALACGIPVVATRVGGNPEIVQDGVNGFLVRPGDPVAVAAAIGRLAADAELRRRMGVEGRRCAQANFSMATMARGYEELYCRALNDLAERRTANVATRAGNNEGGFRV